MRPAPGTRVEYGRGPGSRHAGTVRAGGCDDRACRAVHVNSDGGGLHHVPVSLFEAPGYGWARASERPEGTTP